MLTQIFLLAHLTIKTVKQKIHANMKILSKKREKNIFVESQVVNKEMLINKIFTQKEDIEALKICKVDYFFNRVTRTLLPSTLLQVFLFI